MTKNRVLIVALLLATACFGLASSAWWTMKNGFLGFSEHLTQIQVDDQNQRMIQAIRQSLQHWNETAQLLLTTELEKHSDPRIARTALQETLMNRPPLLAITLFRKSARQESAWKRELRATHAGHDRAVDWPKQTPSAALVSSPKNLEVGVHFFEDRPILSIASIYERKDTYGWFEATTVEIDLKDWATKLGNLSPRLMGYAVDASGRALYLSSSTPFKLGDDLSYLDGVRKSKDAAQSHTASGPWIEMKFAPGESVGFARLIRDAETGITVMTQTRKLHDPGLEDTTRRVTLRLLPLFLLFVFVSSWAMRRVRQKKPLP